MHRLALAALLLFSALARADGTIGWNPGTDPGGNIAFNSVWSQGNIADPYTASSGDTITAAGLWANEMDQTSLWLYTCPGGDLDGGSRVQQIGADFVPGDEIGSTNQLEQTGMSIALSAGTTYCIVHKTRNTFGTTFLATEASAGGESYDNESTEPPASPWGEDGTQAYRLAIYATVTSGGGGPSIPVLLQLFREK